MQPLVNLGVLALGLAILTLAIFEGKEAWRLSRLVESSKDNGLVNVGLTNKSSGWSCGGSLEVGSRPFDALRLLLFAPDSQSWPPVR